MSRRLLLSALALALFALPSGAGDMFKSGPQPGESIAGSFSPLNISG